MSDLARGLLSSLLSERQRQQQLAEQRQYADQQQAEEHQHQLAEQLIRSGITPKDLQGLSGSFASVSPADFNLYVKTADILQKQKRDQEQLQSVGGQIPQLAGLMAPTVGPTGQLLPASNANQTLAGSQIAQNTAQLANLNRPDLIAPMMDQLGLSVADLENTSQQKVNAAKFGTNENIRQSNATNQFSANLQNNAKVAQSIAEDAAQAWDAQTSNAATPPTRQDFKAFMQSKVSDAGVPPAQAADITQKAMGFFPGANADYQKWKRGGIAKGLNEQATDLELGALKRDYPNLLIDQEVRDNVALTQLGQRVQDPIEVVPGRPTWFRASGPQNQQDLLKAREALRDTQDLQSNFNDAYQSLAQARASGKPFSGGPFQGNQLYDALAFMGVNTPEASNYRAQLSRYAISILKSMRLGRLTNQEISYQLLSFPTLAEIGNQNGDIKMKQLNMSLQQQIEAPYSGAQRAELRGNARSAPRLPADLQSLVDDAASGKLDANDPAVQKRLLNGIGAFTTDNPAPTPPATAPLPKGLDPSSFANGVR